MPTIEQKEKNLLSRLNITNSYHYFLVCPFFQSIIWDSLQVREYILNKPRKRDYGMKERESVYSSFNGTINKKFNAELPVGESNKSRA